MFQSCFAVALLALGMSSLTYAVNAQEGRRLEARFQLSNFENDFIRPAITPDGETLAFSNGYALWLWNIRSGRRFAQLGESGKNRFNSIVIPSDGKSICTSGYSSIKDETGGRIDFWDLATLKRTRSVYPVEGGVPWMLQLNSDHTMLAYIASGNVYLYDLEKGEVHSTIYCEFVPSCIAFDNEGKQLAIGGSRSGGKLSVYDIATSDLRHAETRYAITSVAYHPRSNQLYTGQVENDGHIRVWDTKELKEVSNFKVRVDADTRLVFSPEGNHLMFEGDDEEILIYSVSETPTLKATLATNQLRYLYTYRFLPNDAGLISYGEEKISGVCSLVKWTLNPSVAEEGKTLSQLDQAELERELEFGQIVDNTYFDIFGKARCETWKKDMNNGCIYGKFLMAQALLRGIGGVKNERQAMKMIEEAADANNPLAIMYLAKRVAASPREAFEFYTRAAALEHPLAIEYLANCYREGLGVEADANRAFQLSLKAAQMDGASSASKFRVAMAYRNGEGVPQDIQRAVGWLRKAVQAGHPQSIYELGMCYLDGVGQERNPAVAVELFEAGARKNCHEAKLALAFCKEQGEGCEQDLRAAYTIYNGLAQGGFEDAKQKAGELSEILWPKRQSEDRSVSRPTWYTPLPSYGSPGRSQAIYEVQQSVNEAMRDYRSHISGQMGAAGLMWIP